MENAPTVMECQNLSCKSPNPLTNKFCEKCGTVLIKKYLWLLGDWSKSYYQIGELLLERYLIIQPQIVLDTKLASPPLIPDEFPPSILPYLKLFSYRIHIPQIHDYMPPPDERLQNMDIWFLEYGTIPTNEKGELKYPNLLPQLTQLWSESTPIRQLNWLWQIANLWNPLKNQGLAATLLNKDLIRVNNRLIQLLELQQDSTPNPSLKDLGKLWSEWLPQTAPLLVPFLEPLCEKLTQGEIEEAEVLSSLLDRALYHYGQAQERTYHIYTCTDTGKVREHNEDACYPPANQALNLKEPTDSLVIVCDGIGGQDGGEIASNLAIETLKAEILDKSAPEIADNPENQSQRLAEAICTANNVISERNDQEKRQERQRMGTTVVLALAHGHEAYIGHVGDSRVYLITPSSCHQITVDDDLASREVRLGYLVYRDAIQYPNSGALVQAVGMNNAASLHPTVGRFIVDEDCVFLLCSDGLSDNDRVEEYWEHEIVPILTGKKSVSEVGQALLKIANEKNGHDNSTIALLHCQVQPKDNPEPIPSFPQIQASVSSSTLATVSSERLKEYGAFFSEFQESYTPTEPSSSNPSAVRKLVKPNKLALFPLLLGSLALSVLGILGWYLWQRFHQSPVSEPIAVSTNVVTTSLSPGIYKLITPAQLHGDLEVDIPPVEMPSGKVVRILEDASANPDWAPVEICLNGSIVSGWLERPQLSTLLTSSHTKEDAAQCEPPIPQVSPTPLNSP